MMVISKTGDDGTTYDGMQRVVKSDIKIELLGTVDELNCMLGVAYGYADVKTRNLINETQAHLYMLGGYIANYTPCPIETWIDVMDLDIIDWQPQLPAVEGFIKPRAYLQLCKAICRRAERHAVKYESINSMRISRLSIDQEEKEDLYKHMMLVIKFLNRLSDWLFLLARKTDQMV